MWEEEGVQKVVVVGLRRHRRCPLHETAGARYFAVAKPVKCVVGVAKNCCGVVLFGSYGYYVLRFFGFPEGLFQRPLWKEVAEVEKAVVEVGKRLLLKHAYYQPVRSFEI